MGGRSGWCTSRTPEITSDKSIVNSIIMLKFRPIAPKPPGGEAVSSGILKEKSTKNGRGKRKYVRVRGRCRQNNDQCKKRRSKSEPAKELGNEDRPSENSMVRLQLLPERSSHNVNFLQNLEDGDGKTRDDHKMMMGFRGQLGGWREAFDPSVCQRVEVERGLVESQKNMIRALHEEKEGLHYIAREAAVDIIETWINIECFTDAIMEGIGIGFSDKEKLSNLHIDTNPGFVSDNLNNVLWINEAYKRMVTHEENQESAAHEFRVYLLIKEKNIPYYWPEFACRVRVEYNWNGRKCTRTVPCDVWRMEFGGFAWKMDLKAALSLGL
ncbi:Hypothetical predicted protein [Olea europaea subsp. europaea]|uniref:DUF7950 domain-containing protein n=1 Tax=Olea europaea subsp. europaea TaxID=158383 RepID=A0A8S0SMC2_OLEEU|nr:Hypothetical predicted protein [Olea europaea subsp. europaea]